MHIKLAKHIIWGRHRTVKLDNMLVIRNMEPIDMVHRLVLVVRLELMAMVVMIIVVSMRVVRCSLLLFN